MQGFKEFIMRGNLVELAVAFIMGGAFATVVTAFTQIILDVIGLVGGQPDFSQVTIGPINVGVFITALVAFLILSAVIYFGVVKPYNAVKRRYEKVEEVTPSNEELLLTEIRDLLKAQRS